MKNAFPLILLISVTVFSCMEVSHQFFPDKELEVINAAFLDLVGTEFYYEPLPPPPYPLQYRQDKRDSLHYFEELKAIEDFIKNRKIDTSTLVIFTKDTLEPLQDIRQITHLLSQLDEPSDIPDKQAYLPLVYQLAEPELEKKEFDVTVLENHGNYHLLAPKNDEQLPKKARKIGYIGFSRVSFNPEQNKACFYSYFVCGQQCGFGDVCFYGEEKQSLENPEETTDVDIMIPHLTLSCAECPICDLSFT